MNKFYKSITLTALVMVLVGMAGCQKDVDVIGMSEKIAEKTMLGIYTYTSIDSATMNVTKHELALKQAADGAQNGYYRESFAGQGPVADVSHDLTWESAIAADKLSMKITTKLDNGETKNFTWKDGNIEAEGEYYSKSVSGLSDIEVQNGIYDAIQNTVFDGAVAEYHEHLDTVPYLAWKTKVDRKAYLPADTAEAKAKYMNDLAPYIDTIVWYLRTQVPEHTLGYVYLDTVIAGTDTSYVPVNIVYVDPTPNSAGKHLITYLTSETKKRVDQLNDRPSIMVISTMTYKRADNKNTAVYEYRKIEYSNEYYTNPTSPKATEYDSLYVMNADGWVIASISNAKKFDLLLSGKETVVVKETEGGAPKRDESTTKESAYTVLSISGFDKIKGEATQADLKYKLTK